MMNNDVVIFILTHGRPNNQKTYKLLKKKKFSGKIYLVIDSLDKTQDEYLKLFPNEVIIFNKKEVSKTFDEGDNFNDHRAVVYARNAVFEIAKKLNIKYFIQLDDDYVEFNFRFNSNLSYKYKSIKNLDVIISALKNFFETSNCRAIAIGQGGDYFGGSKGTWGKKIFLSRKCMNFFFCSTERPFQFIGRINEDVNTYTHLGSTGDLFFTTNQISLQQTTTQQNKGGLTDIYLSLGTYVKSFYSVMYQPSSVKVKVLNSKNARLHHAVNWDCTVPKILDEKLKKEVS